MPFLNFLVGDLHYYYKILKISPVMAGYIFGVVRNDVAKQYTLKNFVNGMSIEELYEYGDQFCHRVIPKLLRQSAMSKLRWHQSKGHRCILVSASLDVYLEPWAKQHNFDDLLCTRLAISNDGKVNGKLDGNNCYGTEKLKRINDHNYSLGPNTYAYGDSKGDHPLLTRVENGFLLRRGNFVRM